MVNRLEYESSSSQKQSLSSNAYEHIQQRILTGEYPQNELLNEKEIASALGISRTPVREAIKQLTIDGLVRLEPNRGAVVIGLSDEDMHNILLIRAFLEGLCAKWAAEKFTDEQKEKLQEILDLQQFYFERGNFRYSWNAGRSFHQYLYENYSSIQVTNLLKTFHTYIYWRLSGRWRSDNPDQAELSLKNHVKIFKAIKEGDPVLSEQLMAEHLNTTRTW
jgi:DNA-binding GntR family transcriptional regulator